MSEHVSSQLKQYIEEHFLSFARDHEWEITELNIGQLTSSIIYEVRKEDNVSKFAFIYDTSIGEVRFGYLGQKVDAIFYSSPIYSKSQRLPKLAVPIYPIAHVRTVLTEKARSIYPSKKIKIPIKKRISLRRITGERPEEGVRQHLQHLSSTTISQKLVQKRSEFEGVDLCSDKIRAKAEGVSFTIRNAIDYFYASSGGSLNRRIISMYYGLMSFASAEMLADPNGKNSLSEIESITKRGHGLFTFLNDNENFDQFLVGTLRSGFFAEWMKVIGHDKSLFNEKKIKELNDIENYKKGQILNILEILSHFPELSDLCEQSFNYNPRWVSAHFDRIDNNLPSASNSDIKPISSYIKLVDHTKTLTREDLETGDWPVSEITSSVLKWPINNSIPAFRCRVDHRGFNYWHEVLPIYKTPYQSNNLLLLPSLSGISEYRATAFVALYALSIVVRYMPSVWREIEGGNSDQYLTIISTALSVWERLLPEMFLESITDDKIHTTQPGSMLG